VNFTLLLFMEEGMWQLLISCQTHYCCVMRPSKGVWPWALLWVAPSRPQASSSLCWTMDKLALLPGLGLPFPPASLLGVESYQPESWFPMEGCRAQFWRGVSEWHFLPILDPWSSLVPLPSCQCYLSKVFFCLLLRLSSLIGAICSWKCD
jgi:hypothetical protein